MKRLMLVIAMVGLLVGTTQSVHFGWKGVLTTSSPTMPCTIDGVATTCEIDTGSDLFLSIPQSMADHLKGAHFNGTININTGDARHNERSGNVTFSALGVTVKTSTSVDPTLWMPVVGVQLLNKLGAEFTWNTVTQSYSINRVLPASAKGLTVETQMVGPYTALLTWPDVMSATYFSVRHCNANGKTSHIPIYINRKRTYTATLFTQQAYISTASMKQIGVMHICVEAVNYTGNPSKVVRLQFNHS